MFAKKEVEVRKFFGRKRENHRKNMKKNDTEEIYMDLDGKKKGKRMI